ncbi:hypothetical protein [Mycobacterium servetii]|uniref:Uncharacterized protein n=1 Tax=Mycobacterium servetii TaxID=3237418 RepID=A0ABV4CCL0_9MYCO
MSAAADIGRHVLIITATGSFTVAGRSVHSAPVDTADKLGKLILWVRGRGGLRPIPGHSDEPGHGRVWVVGGAVALLTGAQDGHSGDPAEHLGRALGPLVDDGWELRGGPGKTLVLAHGRGPQRVAVEVLAEQQPWLALGDESIANDASELGRRLGRWYATFGVLPGPNGAVSGSVLADVVMAGRTERGRGAVVSGPGLLPSWAAPELRIQPAWAATAEQVEREFQHCDELVCLTQESPTLASAGMLTFGYGTPEPLDASAAVAAAPATKKPFGLWLVELPAAEELNLPKSLPLPHPQMAADHRVQAWVTTEDLDGLTKPTRDGGAGLTVEQLGISEAIVWPHKARILEAWAKRIREAREAFTGDEPMLALVDAAASDYLAALADPGMWTGDDMGHHFQPVWAAAIATHIRYRGRRAAMRISREYHTWPLYIDGPSMVYGPARPEEGSTPVDLSDTHTRLGRLVTIARADLTENAILAMLMAESTADVSAALSAALGVPLATRGHVESVIVERPRGTTPVADDATGDSAEPQPDNGRGVDSVTDPVGSAESEPAPAGKLPSAAAAPPRRRGADSSDVSLGGDPAAVLHIDGLWMPDRTKHEVVNGNAHIGQVAELVYTNDLGYQLTRESDEPGQIWLTEEMCRAFGIDVDAVLEKKPKDRDAVIREVTEGLPFVTEAISQGWRLGGAGPDATATRLGVWTRVYHEGHHRKGVWVVLIPGMASDGDSLQDVRNVPVLVGAHTEDGIEVPPPDQIARRLKLFADAMRFPWKVNPGVTAIDLMVATRPKGTKRKDWCNGPLAPSTFEIPFNVNDVERDFNWTRQPTADERKCRYVHAYDRGGSYPAAIAGLELPIGDPVHHPDGSAFQDPAALEELLAAPGLVTIIVPEPADWRVPFLLNPAGLQFTTPKPVTTARLQQAVKLGYTPTIVEAYSWPNHGRILRGFYERVRDASTVLDTDDSDAQAARDQSKMVRSVGIGLMGSDEHMKGKTGYDPMKRLCIIGKATGNIAYRFDQIGRKTRRWPVAAEKDTVLYVSDNPDPQTAWPGGPKTWGRGFGQYKHEGSALMAEHVEYLNGGAYKGKPALLDPDEWAELMPTFTKPADAKAGR